MHGHHNIDFLIITQKPNLIHRAVIAQVSKHLHILPTWSGRKMLEWPEYVQNPFQRAQIVILPSLRLIKHSRNFAFY